MDKRELRNDNRMLRDSIQNLQQQNKDERKKWTEIVVDLKQQIKELKEYAKHDQECGWWKDGGKNYLDDGCTCGLEELLNK